MANKTLISMTGLEKEYRSGEIVTPVLHGLDVTIHEGEFVSIMGPSGSGKSTLMHILSFLDTGTGGTYKFLGKDVTTFEDDELATMRNEHVGFVFQAFNLLPRTSVTENVRLPLIYSKNPDNKKAVADAIEAVGLTHRKDNLSNQLSGGEKQRVAIARAIVNNPSVIFADEPTGNLDSKTGNQILKILQDLNDSGKTVIMVTHERETAEHADRIIFLRDGDIERDEKITKKRRAKHEELNK
jgi:putative ABC transport system ATP-binding protein